MDKETRMQLNEITARRINKAERDELWLICQMQLVALGGDMVEPRLEVVTGWDLAKEPSSHCAYEIIKAENGETLISPIALDPEPEKHEPPQPVDVAILKSDGHFRNAFSLQRQPKEPVTPNKPGETKPDFPKERKAVIRRRVVQEENETKDRRIRELHALNWNDGQIGGDPQVQTGSVAVCIRRKKLGLPAVPRTAVRKLEPARAEPETEPEQLYDSSVKLKPEPDVDDTNVAEMLESDGDTDDGVKPVLRFKMTAEIHAERLKLARRNNQRGRGTPGDAETPAVIRVHGPRGNFAEYAAMPTKVIAEKTDEHGRKITVLAPGKARGYYPQRNIKGF